MLLLGYASNIRVNIQSDILLGRDSKGISLSKYNEDFFFALFLLGRPVYCENARRYLCSSSPKESDTFF